MKKILISLTLLFLMLPMIFAFVTYTGQPQFPYLIFGIVDWNSQLLGGARIELTNINTGYSTIITTNEDGYWQEDVTNWLSNSAARPPVMFGDNIKVKTLDGCGSADVCEVTFAAFSEGNENSARKDLSVTGALLPSPSSGGGGGGGGGSGGGGGGGGGSVPTWTCKEWSSCENKIQTRICTQNQYTSKEKRSCVASEPVVTPPAVVVPPVVVPPEQYTCSDGTQVTKKEDCPIPTKEHEQIVVDKLKGLKIFGVSAVIIALIAGLYKYLRKKGKFGQAEKTAKTFIDKRSK